MNSEGRGLFPGVAVNNGDNQELLVARDFASIKAKCDADWEPVEPNIGGPTVARAASPGRKN